MSVRYPVDIYRRIRGYRAVSCVAMVTKRHHLVIVIAHIHWWAEKIPRADSSTSGYGISQALSRMPSEHIRQKKKSILIRMKTRYTADALALV